MQSMERSNWTMKEDSSFISNLLCHSMWRISKYILLDDKPELKFLYVAGHHKGTALKCCLFCLFTKLFYSHSSQEGLFKTVNCLLCRTIMALWKARSLTPEQKVQLVEEESEMLDAQSEENGSFLGIENAKMSEVFSSTKHIDVRFHIPLKHNV